MHKASVEETLKLKRLHVDQWSIKEQLALASSVLRSGDQNWASVSRAIKPFGEKDRPNDWFSQKNCALQYEKLLENVETPKRRRGDKGEESKPVTPGELIVEKLRTQRLEELQSTMDVLKRQYRKTKQDVVQLNSGEADDRLDHFDAEIEQEHQKEEDKKKKHEIWLKEREEKISEIQRAWRPLTFLRKKPVGALETSVSSDAELSQDSVLSESISAEQQAEDSSSAEQKPNTTTPTSPLLTHLLKSPASTSQPSILHNAIMRPTTSSPTITSLLASSTPTKREQTMFSPALSNLVSSAVSGAASGEQSSSGSLPSSGAPTLSMLLELPPSVPGTPLPELPAKSEVPEAQQVDAARRVVKAETPLKRPSVSATDDILQSTVESSMEFEEQLQKFDKNAVDSSKTNVLEELPQDVVELIEEVEEAAEAKKQQGELSQFLSTQAPQPAPVEVQPKAEPAKPVEPKPVEEEEDVEIEEVEKEEKEVEEAPKETLVKTEVEPEEEVMEVDEVQPAEKADSPESVEEVVEAVPETKESKKEEVPVEVPEKAVEPEAKEDVKEEAVVEKETIKVPEKIQTRKSEPLPKEPEEEKDSELEESSDDDYKPRPRNIMTYPARTKRNMLRRQTAPPAVQSTTDESMPNSPVSLDEERLKSWKKAMLLIWDRIAAHKNASLFLKAITNEQVPGYRNVVLRPMDLTTIKRNIETGNIFSTEAFQRDLRLIFLNAIMYNSDDHDITMMAYEMQKDCIEEFQVYTAAQESKSYRRETREGSRRHDTTASEEADTPAKYKFVTIISDSSDESSESTS